MAKTKVKVYPGTVFHARNFHYATCGKPPGIKAAYGQQTSYFENEMGEQMVYVFDYKTQKAVVYHGDAGWSPARKVDLDKISCSIMSSQDELLWLSACVKVSRHHIEMAQFRKE